MGCADRKTCEIISCRGRKLSNRLIGKVAKRKTRKVNAKYFCSLNLC